MWIFRAALGFPNRSFIKSTIQLTMSYIRLIKLYIQVTANLDHSCLSAAGPAVPDVVTLIVNTLQFQHSTPISDSQ